MADEMKPSAFQPYMLGKMRTPTHHDTTSEERREAHAEGQRTARAELRKSILSLIAADMADDDVLSDALLAVVKAWMFTGPYALEVDDDRPDSIAVPRDERPDHVRQQD